jgi:hypothetical protein
VELYSQEGSPEVCLQNHAVTVLDAYSWQMSLTEKSWFHMGKPEQTPGRDDYSCALQVTGIGNERVYRIFGVDAFQAIALGFGFMGERLELLNQEAGGRLRWECDDKGGFGFPELL